IPHSSMPSQNSDAALPPPPTLEDDVIELRLLRILGPADAAARSSAAQFIASAPEYRFAIHRRRDGVRVGRIHLRITQGDRVLRAVGHAGYAVDHAHQRQGHATRAVRLIQELAREHALSPLWILIAPDNIASRRTVERAGFQLVDIVGGSPEALAIDVAPDVCRYRWDGHQNSAPRPAGPPAARF
ncbi:MAG: GNAT family N-acetyltransferase, partial [Gemmatimonas sp.]